MDHHLLLILGPNPSPSGGEVAHSEENLHKMDEFIPAESSHGGNLLHAVYCPSLHLQRVSHNFSFSFKE